MIHNIVFDMGGVLYRFEPEIAYCEYPGEDGQILYDAPFSVPKIGGVRILVKLMRTTLSH